MADATMRALAGVLIRVFFRRVEVDRPDRLPTDRPVLLVANHTNGLVDGLLLIAELRRYPRFLGKATLFKILPLKPFLRLAGVVPVYRVADGANAAGNDEAFRRCRQLLAGGGVVAIFPEGISHDEASLQPLKTGAARIALGAADEGAARLAVVPVGLAYDAKARFRSQALVRIGDPLDVVAGADVHDLTASIDAALRAVGPDFRSVEQSDELAEIAAVVVGPDATLVEREELTRRLAKVDDVDLAPVREAAERYRRDLVLLGATDADVVHGVSRRRVRLVVAKSVLRAAVTAPAALAGAVVHVVPYQVMKQLARLPKNEGMKSTVKLLGCFALFTLTYVGVGVAVGRRARLRAGIGAAVLAPAAGYTTLRFAERVHDAGGVVHGYATLRSRGSTIESVRANRARLVALVAAQTS